MNWNVPMMWSLKKIPAVKLDNALYKKYVRMIQKAAWQASKVCSESYDELLSRGNLLFCEATKTYNPNKGAFSTHLGWKLLTLKQTASEMYAPRTCKDERTFWCSLEESTMGKDGDEISGDPLMASTIYSDKISEDDVDGSWEQRIPDFRRYMEAMDEDSRQLCNDILDGYFDDADLKKSMGDKAYMNRMANIPMTRFHSRRYVKLGWSKVRTQNALDNLRQMCRLWMNNKLPCKIKRIEPVSIDNLF